MSIINVWCPQLLFHWKADMYIHLHIVFGYLHVTMAELSSYDQDGIVYRAQTICYQTLSQEVCGPLSYTE